MISFKVLITHCLFSRRLGPMRTAIDKGIQSLSWGFITSSFSRLIHLKWNFQVMIDYVHTLIEAGT